MRLAAALSEGENNRLALAAKVAFLALADVLVRLFPADVGFVRLNDFALTTERPANLRRHGSADAMAHEPSGLVGDTEHALELKRAHPLLARHDQMRRE